MTIVTKRTIDLSGFGEGYEDECQRIMWRAVRYMEDHHLSFDDVFTPPKTIPTKSKNKEITYRDNPNYIAMDKAAILDPGTSGAMAGVALQGASVIAKHGLEKALQMAQDQGREIITWEGDLDIAYSKD